MNAFRIGMLLLFISNFASACTAYNTKMLVNSKSNFPEVEEQTRGLIKKIYLRLIPTYSQNSTHSDMLYPGRLYDVGGDHLHLFCIGESKKGIPTVLFESGVGGSSADWIPIQVKLSKRTRMCAYERPGYGWSDEWSGLKNIQSLQNVIPRSIDQNVEILESLLKKANITDPLILVGHSYGGPISLAFEAKYPAQVSGLVLLDPHDDGIIREDRTYTDEISRSLDELENLKSPEFKAKWEAQLKEISGHLDGYSDGKVEAQTLAEDLGILVNFLDQMKWYRVLWSEWKALHSSCAKVRANPSKTLRHKALAVISSDPTLPRSEGQSYFHMKIAKQSNQGKFYFALGSSHNIVGDSPELVLRVMNEILDSFEGKSQVRSRGATLPKFKVPTRFFVDGEMAEYVRTHSQEKGKHEKLENFCHQLDLGFKTAKNFGFYKNPQTGIMGYYVICE